MANKKSETNHYNIEEFKLQTKKDIVIALLNNLDKPNVGNVSRFCDKLMEYIFGKEE